MKASIELNYKHKILGITKTGLASLLSIFMIFVSVGLSGIFLLFISILTFSIILWFEFNRPEKHLWHLCKSLFIKKEFLHAKTFAK